MDNQRNNRIDIQISNKKKELENCHQKILLEKRKMNQIKEDIEKLRNQKR